jgi:FixJ family two-component response regulator
MDAHRRVAHCFGMQSHPGSSATERLLLSVVDDDESVRESLPDLLREFGFATRAFSSAEEFLSSDCIDETRCLILDVVMPRMGGLELHHELMRRGQNIPVVFITAQKDEAVRARMFAQGAAGFLLKPFSDTDLLAAVEQALRPD